MLKNLRVALVISFCLVGTIAQAGEYSANGCSVRWNEKELTVGNALFFRSYVVSNDVLRTRSFGMTGEAGLVSSTIPYDRFSVSCDTAKWSPASAEGVSVRVRYGAFETRLCLWPEVPGVLSFQPTPRPMTECSADVVSSSSYRRIKRRGERLLGQADPVADVLTFRSTAIKGESLTLLDQTDIRNELVQSREWIFPSAELDAELATSVLDCRDLFTDRGVVFLKMSPMPSSRSSSMADFVLSLRRCSVAALDTGHPLASLVYVGGEVGRIAALQALQRAVRPYRSGRDGVFISNTWGDGNRDARINAEFIGKEIEAGAQMGVEVIQIDDGWQKGRTINSSKVGGKKVWNEYWATDENYWEPDCERFPLGLGPIVALARRKGLGLGLWFGPDSSDDAANWERDADKLLEYFRTYGIAHFKIDSLKLQSHLALQRNRRFFDKMLLESDATMVFDLDCTAEVRPGFLGLMDVGPLFVENRYARDDARLYRPHLTLRSLWTLSHVIDPVRLRIEVLNPRKGMEFYGDDPLAPSRWPADALFAIAMTSSPLAWMELSDVGEDVVRDLRPLVATWKRERATWHGGTIFPIGECPDGFSWTGFISRNIAGEGGYALVFRELNESSSFVLPIGKWFLNVDRLSAEVIAGRGSAEVTKGGLSVNVSERLGFLWVKLVGRE